MLEAGMKTESINNGNRNLGIELLRIVSILLVLILHTLRHGGILDSVDKSSPNYTIVWLLEATAFCSVDVFVMIAGYVNSGKNTLQMKFSRIAELWLVVFFYSSLLPLALRMAGYEIERGMVINGFFPLLRQQYWFFNAYFAMFLLMPALNCIAGNEKLLSRTSITAFVLFAVLPLFSFNIDLFNTGRGYSCLWFSVLYLFGAMVKTGKLPEMKRHTALLLFLAMILVMVSFRNLLTLSDNINIRKYRGMLFSYTSPTVVICAGCLLKLFSEVRIETKAIQKCILFFSPLTFGVYLIHDNLSVRSLLITDAFASLGKESPGMMLLHLFGAVLVIFLVCAGIDYIRSLLFRLLRIKQLVSVFDRRDLIKKGTA